VSAHYAAEAATAIHWNRLSDHVGRKPVLLSCLAGTIVAILSFGLSRSFWALVLRYDNSSRAGPLVGGDVPLTCEPVFNRKPLPAGRAKRKHWRREKRDSGAHRRN
jgi:hypothetical protein